MNTDNSLVTQFSGLIGLPREVIIKAMTFGGSLIKEPLSEVTQILVDDIRYLRVRNQVNLLIRANNYFEKKGLKPNKVPVKTLVPLLEGCSLEEDVSLQNMWEALLINSATPNNNAKFISGYIDILKQLSPEEAKFLDLIYTTYKNIEFSFSSLDDNIYAIELVELYIDNFLRMNLIKNILPELLHKELEDTERDESWRYNKGDDIFPRFPRYWTMDKEMYRMTKLGMDFVTNCKLKE